MGVGDLVRSGVGGIEGIAEVHVREQMAQVGDRHLELALGIRDGYNNSQIAYLAHIMREVWAVFSAR